MEKIEDDIFKNDLKTIKESGVSDIKDLGMNKMLNIHSKLGAMQTG
jgi:hypothetical protein